MFIEAIRRKIRKSEPVARSTPSVSTVDIELPLVLPKTAPVLTPQQQWERELSPATRAWLVKLPPLVRPHHLADTFPRIANRLALVWRDADLVDKVLDDLLVDKRGGRRGFPAEVSAELLRLHSFHERRRPLPKTAEVGALGRAWDQHLQASADR